MATMTIEGVTYEGTVAELADIVRAFAVIGTEQAVAESLKVGDYAKALRVSQFGDIKAGEVVEITDLDAADGDDPYSIEGITEFHECYFRPQDLVKVVAPAKPATAKPKVGDIVVITANTNGSRNAVGDVGKTEESISHNGLRVVVPGKTRGNGNFTKFTEMRPATPAEIERYTKDAEVAKRAEVFTKAGRKVDEYKAGDIVRLKQYTGADKEGCIVEIREDGGNTYRRLGGDRDWFGSSAKWFEPVAFVDSRVDAK